MAGAVGAAVGGGGQRGGGAKETLCLVVFLVGAYQEILGDLHNLFGDTHAVHVSLDGSDNMIVDEVVKGDTVREVLDYVEFDSETLVRKLRHDVELVLYPEEHHVMMATARPDRRIDRLIAYSEYRVS